MKTSDLEKYISLSLGIKTTVIPFNESLPLLVTSAYETQETTIFEQRVCLLIKKDCDQIPTPAQLYKQMHFVMEQIGIPVVYVFEKIASYNIERMMKKTVNFIILNKQAFIPMLATSWRKMPKMPPVESPLLSSFAQFLLLYHLQKEMLTGFTAKQLSDKFAQPYRTVSRAINDFKRFRLCDFTNGKEKHLQFVAKGKKLWLQAQDYFQNPVERHLFIDQTLHKKQVYISNINALAHFTMLNEVNRKTYAVYKNEIKNLTIQTHKYVGDHTIEVWRYNPQPLSENGFVDKLSLYLLFKNDYDDRIQIELEHLINEIQWLEG